MKKLEDMLKRKDEPEEEEMCHWITKSEKVSKETCSIPECVENCSKGN